MKTSKPEQNEQTSENLSTWNKFLNKLDARPSRTATCMAVILIISFIFSTVHLVYRLNQPKPEVSQPVPALIQQMRIQMTDSMSISDKLNEYFILLEIQRELQEMMRDSSKIDSARVEQLYEILKIK